jgi:hypothetical protein
MVKKACNCLDKRQQWLEGADIENTQPQSWKKKAPTTIESNKTINSFNNITRYWGRKVAANFFKKNYQICREL